MSPLRRRLRSIPTVAAGAVGLTLLAPLWVVISAVFDLVTGARRLPTTRLLAFATAWCWLEVAGVTWAAALWVTGQRSNLRAHYALQRWWVTTLIGALRTTTGIRVAAHGAERLAPGPTILLARHASLADSLISAWVVTVQAQLRPHYVLKRELLMVPNLDVVGNRLPNCFIDRDGPDAADSVAALTATAARLGTADVMVIFPEGTRSSPDKRQRALDRIADRDPQRAQRLGGLTHLLPPRPGGTLALLRGAPQAAVAVAWHTGLDGLDTFRGMRRALRHSAPEVRFGIERVDRPTLPGPAGDVSPDVERWLDEQWLALDRQISAAAVTR